MTEHVIGFDIRYYIDIESIKDELQKDYPYISYPKSFSHSIWPSHFRDEGNNYSESDPIKANFRVPNILGIDNKYIVYDRYSETFFIPTYGKN